MLLEGDSLRNRSAKHIALGGLLAAMAVVIMSLGGIIPFATYVCCVLCMVLGRIVLGISGRRMAWTWYAAVSFLSIILGPDKEAAALYVFIGYYPIIKVWFERFKISIVFKLGYFNATIILLYWLLMNLFGMTQLAEDFYLLGMIGLVVMLVLGNLTFVLTDILLTMMGKRGHGNR